MNNTTRHLAENSIHIFPVTARESERSSANTTTINKFRKTKPRNTSEHIAEDDKEILRKTFFNFKNIKKIKENNPQS